MSFHFRSKYVNKLEDNKSFFTFYPYAVFLSFISLVTWFRFVSICTFQPDVVTYYTKYCIRIALTHPAQKKLPPTDTRTHTNTYTYRHRNTTYGSYSSEKHISTQQFPRCTHCVDSSGYIYTNVNHA